MLEMRESHAGCERLGRSVERGSTQTQFLLR